MKPQLYAVSILSLFTIAGLAAVASEDPPASVQGAKTSPIFKPPFSFGRGTASHEQAGPAPYDMAQRPARAPRTYACASRPTGADEDG
jgi:hypothetical protein